MEINNIWEEAANGGVTEVQEIIAKSEGKLNANSRDDNGYTPVTAATTHGRIDLLRWLLDNGGDVNVRDEDQDTPFHHFACAGEDLPEDVRKETCAVLVKYGGNPELTNEAGQTAFDIAIENENADWFFPLFGKDPPPPVDPMDIEIIYEEEDEEKGEKEENEKENGEAA